MPPTLVPKLKSSLGRLNLFHSPTDLFSCWGFQRPASATPSGDHFRLAAFVHHRTSGYQSESVPTPRILIWIVPSQGDAAEAAAEMYSVIERCVVILIIQGRKSLRAQNHIMRRAILWERYEAANLTYSELKRSHELIQ
jgi:hypothetical protein